MDVRLADRSHHLEQDEPDSDGLVGWTYEYDLYVLVASQLEVTARSYTDTSHEVSLLAFRCDGAPIGLGDVKQSHVAAVEAAAGYLRSMGFTSVQWLDGETYVGSALQRPSVDLAALCHRQIR